MIATSLALALGVSVASGAATCASNTGAPSICANGSTDDISTTLGINWIGINDGSDKIYQPYRNSSPISVLAFTFSGASTSGTNIDMNSYNSFEINGNGKSVKMNNGTGTLEFRFGGASNKNITLNFDNLDIPTNHALYGNLFIGGNGNNNTFNGTFGGKGIKGNITFDGSSAITSTLNFAGAESRIDGNLTINNSGINQIIFASNTNASITGNINVAGGTTTITNLDTLKGNIIGQTNSATGTITFDTKVAMTGDITRIGTVGNPKAGDLIVNFNNGSTLTGNIQTGIGGDGNDFSANQVTFNGASSATDIVLTGNIISYGTGGANSVDTNNGNQIVFTQGSMKGNVTAIGKKQRVGYNKLTFSQAGARLDGDVTAKVEINDTFMGYGQNKITFTNGGTLNGTILSEAMVFQSGNTRFGTNELIFSQGTSEISGSIQANWYNGGGSNVARGKNIIAMSGTNNIISAHIISNGGINTIDFNVGTNLISGEIQAYNNIDGTNTITFASGTTNSITGSITASGGTNSITDTSTSLSVSGNINANSGKNTVNSNTNLTLSNNSLFASGGTNTITATGSLTLTNISLSASGGSNTITTNALGNSSTIASIQATGGKNTITTSGAGDLTITRGISTVTYGNNTRGNTITLADGNLTIGQFDTNIVDPVYGDTTGSSIHAWNGGNSNTITLSKNGATLTLAGNITSGGGSTGNTINFDGDSGILKSSSGNFISSSGTTNFSILSLQIQNNSGNTGTLITTSGTTNLNFRNSTNGSLNGNISTTGGTTNLVLKDGQSYSFTGTLSTSAEGKNIIDLSSKSATISNDLTFSGSDVTGAGGNIINIGGNKTLTLSESSTAKTINTSGGVTHLNFNGNGGSIAGNVATSGGKTRIKFVAGSTTLTGNVTTSGGNTAITFNENAQVTGTLGVSDTGTTNITIASGKTGTITGAVSAGGASLTADIGEGSTLSLNSGSGTITTSAGNTAINFNGTTGTLNGNIATSNSATTTFNLGLLDSESATAIIENSNTITNSSGATNTFNINATTTTLQYDNGLVFSAGTNNINFENTNGATLNWQTNGSENKAISTTGGSTNINFIHSGIITADSSKTSITTNGAGAITNINISTGARGTIEGAITLGDSGGSNKVTFKGSNGGLILKETSTLTNVTNSEGGVGNAISFYHEGRSGKNDFKTLTIGTKAILNKENSKDGISGSGLNFLVYAVSNKSAETTPEVQPSTRLGGGVGSTSYADKIVIHSSSNKEASTHHLGVVFEDGTHFDDVVYEKGGKDNILVATVVNSSQVTFNQTEKTILGFTTADVSYVTESTNENGNAGSDYTSYYIGKVSNAEVIVAEQEITATAFTLNYDLYMANFNSLNKRMGELRENAHSQGVWARVFNGAQTNDFGLGSKSNYTTIQAGYDYAFGFEGANNYLGVALSYALSTSTSNNKAFDSLGQQREIGNIYSNAVEVAIYNSYVSDMGWYNDSIAKFSYLMSSFDIDNLNTGSSTKNNTNNFALTFGDEVGYVFKLGESKEWSITPQVELTFGYFNQSDFKQTLANSMAYLASSADAVLTLRSRVGSSFAYDFKKFTQDKGINASVYVGAFYEYDYVSGGSITMSTDQMSGVENILSDISSDGRVVMNVGTNMTIKDNTRIYFDFEKSFAGKITTDYQVNVGVRYSFGESNGYTPMIEKAEFKAPLKVESESEEEVEEEASKESEANTTEQSNANESKIDEKTQSQDSKEQSNAENKVEEKKDAKEESKEGKEVSKAK